MILPISSSEFAEIVPTCAIDLSSLHGCESFLSSSMMRDRALVDAALQVHRIEAGGHRLQAFAQDRLREHRGGRRAVAGGVGRLRSDLLHHLHAHVLELVLELDLFRDRDAVLRDGRGAEALLEHDVAAFRAEGDFDCVREHVDAFQHALTGIIGKSDFFRSRHDSVS